MFNPDCTLLRKIILLGLLGSLSSDGQLFAEPEPDSGPRLLSLSACVNRALTENPTLQAGFHRWQAAQERAGQARTRPNPRFEAAVENFTGSGEYQGGSSAESSFSLSQEIELGGKYRARSAEATAESAVAQAEYESLKRDLVRDTQRAFIAVLVAQKKRRLADETQRLATDIEAATRLRVTAGKTAPLESDRVRMETARAEWTRAEAERDLATARQSLAAKWGAEKDDFETAEGLPDVPPIEIPPLENLLARLTASPDLIRVEALLRSAEARLRSAQAARVPNVEVSAGFRRFADTDDSAFMAGLSLELPVMTRNAGGIRAAAAERDAVHKEGTALRTALTLELRQLHARLLNQGQRLVSLKDILLPAAERTRDAAQTGYREGQFGYLEVLDTQRAYAELQGEWLDSLADYHTLQADLARLTGTYTD